MGLFEVRPSILSVIVLRWSENKERDGCDKALERTEDEGAGQRSISLLFRKKNSMSTPTTCIHIAGVDFVNFAH